MSFKDLGLEEWIVDQLKVVGFKTPTEVQENCIPAVLQGRDCLGCSKTGSGKTAAFALPILQSLARDPYGIFALVLTPTRELAYQIAEQFRAFGKPMHLRDVVVVGGMDMMKQSLALAQYPHVVIATPGRLADHIKSTDTFSFKKIKYIVMDEADRLLEPSFQDDLTVIFDALPRKRQTLLFSATLTESLENLKSITKEPFFWESKSDTATVSRLDQRFILTPHLVKDTYLVKILDELCTDLNKTAIVFTHSCRECQVYSMLFKHFEFSCTSLHSLMSQTERLAALAQFKSNKVKILVATDVASRGLDIPDVEAVINVSVPGAPKDYLHRVGRTARAGRKGLSVTLVTQYDVTRLQSIESYTGVKMGEYPNEESEVLKNLNTVSVARREVELILSEQNFGESRRLNKRKRLIEDGKPQPDASRRKQSSEKASREFKQTEDTPLKKTEDTPLKKTESTPLKKKATTQLKKTESTPLKKKATTQLKKAESIQLKKKATTQLKKAESTQLKKKATTQLKKAESTQLKKKATTQLKKAESIHLKKKAITQLKKKKA